MFSVKNHCVYNSLLCFIFLFSCNTENNKGLIEIASEKDTIPLINESLQAGETQAMANLLADLHKTGSPDVNIYLNVKRAEMLKLRLNEPGVAKNGKLWYHYCIELLAAGNVRECIREIENYFDKKYPLTEQMTRDNYVLFELLALAYLRLGEQENCQINHTAFSCILPIEQPAFHTLPEGSTRAIQIYQSMYDRNPINAYKWLINVAYMTLGKHPQEVPEKYLINYPNWELEQKQFPRFKEVAMHVDAAINGLSGGVCAEDFNNDGFIDLFVTDLSLIGQSRLLINNGKGKFVDQTEQAGLKGIVGGLNCIQADYNNDGFTDIFVLRGAWLENGGKHPNSLLKNNGDGTFSDVTKSANIISYNPTQTAAWADFNKDGYLDLFIGNESSTNAINPCELYENNGDGTFKEVALSAGVAVTAFVKGVAWGDINNDGWPDLLISVLRGKNLLFKNVGGKFENISVESGIEEPIESFPCWFWDVNNDGYQDIYISGYGVNKKFVVPNTIATAIQGGKLTNSLPKLYINNGDETFKDATDAYNLSKPSFAMGANFGDLDNDGFLDFYLSTGEPGFDAITPNRMFRNINGQHFEEVTSAGGFGHIQKGHAVAFSDFDNDGDQDVYAVMGGAYESDKFTNVLFNNPGFDNNWIVLLLEGVSTNRSAIGASIELQLDNGKKVFRSVSTGGSFGANALQQEIGLGKSTKIKKIVISWQNGGVQVLENVDVNQKIKIVEGDETYQKMIYKHMPFAKSNGQHHHH